MLNAQALTVPWRVNEIFVLSCDKSGDYVITQLPTGSYSIKAISSGFKTWTVPQVNLAIGDRLRQDVQLQLGNLEQSVEVTAASPALQTDSSSLSNLVSTQALQNLPLNGLPLPALENRNAELCGRPGIIALSLAGFQVITEESEVYRIADAYCDATTDEDRARIAEEFYDRAVVTFNAGIESAATCDDSHAD